MEFSETSALMKAAYKQLRDQGATPEEAQAIIQEQLDKAIPKAAALIMEDPRIQAMIKGGK
ncbi:MAG: hypothetical protein ABL932_14265 [Terricaulis sp.]